MLHMSLVILAQITLVKLLAVPLPKARVEEVSHHFRKALLKPVQLVEEDYCDSGEHQNEYAVQDEEACELDYHLRQDFEYGTENPSEPEVEDQADPAQADQSC